MATGNGARDRLGALWAVSVFALPGASLRFYRREGRFSVGQAEAVVAAGHSTRLPCGGPEGTPEQDHGEKTDQGGELFSRSDRELEPASHWFRVLIVSWPEGSGTLRNRNRLADRNTRLSARKSPDFLT